MNVEIKIPNVGESIQDVLIGQWLKKEGDAVEKDETVVELETDKASMELAAPIAGVLARILKQAGEQVAVGETIAHVEEKSGATTSAKPKPQSDNAQSKKKSTNDQAAQPTSVPASTAQAPKPAEAPQAAESNADAERRTKSATVPVTPSARRALRQYGLQPDEIETAGKRVRREDVMRHVESQQQNVPAERPAQPISAAPARETLGELEEVVPMSLIRRRIAERLVEAKQKTALLTTFNEADMSAVMELRKKYRDQFETRYGIKLGFMSFFVKAAIDGLKQFPEINAEIRDTSIVYRHYYHIGIAIGSQRGLVVPVLRNAERLSFADIEKAIDDFARRAGDNKLKPHELEGGTFTISNGGIYGSLLSTPIVNPPQSGVLGMHAIQERPVAREGQVVIRPMMYLALTYDHRIVDGREAVSFLKRVKENIEEPSRMLIEA